MLKRYVGAQLHESRAIHDIGGILPFELAKEEPTDWNDAPFARHVEYPIVNRQLARDQMQQLFLRNAELSEFECHSIQVHQNAVAPGIRCAFDVDTPISRDQAAPIQSKNFCGEQFRLQKIYGMIERSLNRKTLK